MDFSGSLHRGKKRTGEAADYSWASEEIQEVLSRGIQDQEWHLRKILLSSTRPSSESQLQCAAGAADTGELLELRQHQQHQLEEPPVHNMNWSQQLAMQLAGRKILRRSLTAKLQNSQDRCHALGLKQLQTSPSLQATVPKSQEAAFNIPRYSKHDIEHKSSDEPASLDSLDMQHPSCSKLMKLQHRRNLNSLRTPERTVPDSSLLTTSLFDEAAQAAFSSRSSMSCFVSNSRKTSSISRLVDPSGVDKSLNMLASDLEPVTQGQNFQRLKSALGILDTDAAGCELQANLNMDVAAAHHNKKEQPITAVASEASALPQSSSSSNHMKMGAVRGLRQEKNHNSKRKITRPCSDLVNSRPSRRNPIPVKRERESARREESHEEVVQVLYQRLRPVVDHVVRKTRIPEDGHQRWKKYGSKAIRNAYFCRAYYKCNSQDCSAKKIVQPTDEDPSVFRVTYMGTHTCSKNKHRSESAAPFPERPVNATAATAHADEVESREAALDHLDHQDQDHQYSSKLHTTAPAKVDQAAARQVKEPKTTLRAAAAASSVRDEGDQVENQLEPGLLILSDRKADHASNAHLAAAPDGASTEVQVGVIEEKTLDQLLLQQQEATDFSAFSWSQRLAAGSCTAHTEEEELTMISSDLDDFADQALSATSDISSSCSRSELAGQSRAPETAQHDMEIMINTSHASGRDNNILLPAISMSNFEEFDTQLDRDVDRLLGQIDEAFSFQEPMFDHWADDLLEVSAFCSAGNNLL
ncbi:unnamed protein product [Sphagnum troendelagicum]|uniref:WRKY domain-containing protein n=1 Tax=Sphagnum troendelagicum TaxID=128251 RepID=A0ABP0U459_9BRYO